MVQPRSFPLGDVAGGRFKSVIVESGTAARTMAAYIDLNPVRAGMVEDPAEYRWSSYGEAVGGRVKGCRLTRSGGKGNGKKAREGLVRAISSDTDRGFDAGKWKDASRRYRRLLGIALDRKTLNSKLQTRRKSCAADGMNEAEALAAVGEGRATEDRPHLPELTMARMLRHRVRYFTDGAVVGSKEFVNDAFDSARERFSGTRQDGARRMRGNAAAARDLWSMRALRVGIE